MIPPAADLYAKSQRAFEARGGAEALALIDEALQGHPNDPYFLVHRGRCLLALGRVREAREAAASAQQHAVPNAALLGAIGSVFNVANDHVAALAAYDRAVRLAPDDARMLYNRAAVRRFVGEFAQAEADYDRVIALDAHDYEAYLNRSHLRIQTRAKNHAAEIEALLAGNVAEPQGEVFLRYALAKEYEDLQDYARSFAHLQRGAQLRRKHLRYDVAVDVATVDWIIGAFARPAPPPPDASTAAPIFIVGLPRSGSTLVDRILGSHSQAFSAGELHAFALTLVAAVRRQSGGVAVSRQELIARSAQVDFATLGSDYLKVASAGVPVGLRFTDKMPLNYLYIGLILRALPNARIVHVSRSPMAAGYAMYKMLFADGYPFSYDLREIGQYYVAYRRLMAHWRRLHPNAIHELAYEDLVADQRGETRKLLAFCGLDWQDECGDFHLNTAPTSTASASQVREPLNGRSLAQWRHYAEDLTGLRDILSAAGID